MHPTEWLEALPQSTLLDLMRCRCCYIGAAAKICGQNSERVVKLKALSNVEISQLESQIISHRSMTATMTAMRTV